MKPVVPVEISNAPKPGGHYSQGILHEGIIYVSGQLPIPLTGAHEPQAPFEIQARRAIENVLAIVSGGGGSAASLLKITAYIVGIENWSAFNAVYAELLGESKPARAVVPVAALHHGYLIEVDAIAAAQ
jgi:2-iminobutanoate/2-iminopropanoate deaminase